MVDTSEDLINPVIRKMRKEDTEVVVDIWYKASIQAHSFIPKKYWEENKDLMKDRYLPKSDVYLAVKGKVVIGFIALVGNDLAAIFIESESQGAGVGSLLIDYAKSIRNVLQLKVYEKNKDSVQIYKKKVLKLNPNQ